MDSVAEIELHASLTGKRVLFSTERPPCRGDSLQGSIGTGGCECVPDSGQWAHVWAPMRLNGTRTGLPMGRGRRTSAPRGQAGLPLSSCERTSAHGAQRRTDQLAPAPDKCLRRWPRWPVIASRRRCDSGSGGAKELNGTETGIFLTLPTPASSSPGPPTTWRRPTHA